MPNPIITAALTGPIATKADNPACPARAEEIAATAKAALRGRRRGRPHPPARRRAADRRPRRRPAHRRGRARGVPGHHPALHRGPAVHLRGAHAYGRGPAGHGHAQPVHHDLRHRPSSSNPPEQMTELAARMIELGVKPEVEIYDTGHLDMMLDLLKKGLLVEPLQVSFVMGVRGGMRGDPALLSWLVRELPAGTSWQVIAVGRANLPMTTIGLAMGGNARTGMEDTLHAREGRAGGVQRPAGRAPGAASRVPWSASRPPWPRSSSGSSFTRSWSTRADPRRQDAGRTARPFRSAGPSLTASSRAV